MREVRKGDTQANPRVPEKRKPSQRLSVAVSQSNMRRTIVIIVFALIFILLFLYPVSRDYYQNVRNEQRLQAQLDAVNARNAAVQAENDALQTEEGIENQARSDLGWVKEGENSAVVTNNQGTVDITSKLPDHIDVNSITAPHTWYYSILDAIFFVHS